MASRGFPSCHDLLEDDLLGVMKEHWYVELTSGSRLSDLHAHGLRVMLLRVILQAISGFSVRHDSGGAVTHEPLSYHRGLG